VFAIGPVALRQQGTGAFPAGLLALFLQVALFVIVPSAFALAAGEYVAAVWPAVSPGRRRWSCWSRPRR
jgi:hypothetical protein